MRGLILAAGRGSRLGTLTEDIPKGLVQLQGKSLLEWQMSSMQAAGVDRIAIVRGYRGQLIDFPGVHNIDNARWNESNMVVSLCCASTWLTADVCIISYADIVYQADHVRQLVACPADLTVTYDVNWLDLWKRRFDCPLDDAESFKLDSNGRVVEIGKRMQDIGEAMGQYMGLLKFSPRGWARIEAFLRTISEPDLNRLDMTALLSRLIERGVEIQGVPIHGGWFEIDTPADLALCKQTWAAEEPTSKTAYGKSNRKC